MRPSFISNQYVLTLKGHNVIGLQVSCKSLFGGEEN